MGILRHNIETENWISASSRNWSILNDQEYRQLIKSWQKSFGYNTDPIYRGRYGNKARIKFQNLLPVNCYLFSGITVEPAANMGGKISQAYNVERLTKIDWNLCMTEEIIISTHDFLYTLVCSHEEGYEIFYESLSL